ncbi:reverse transcriptase domain-containing protein [Tanacetum coccineum]
MESLQHSTGSYQMAPKGPFLSSRYSKAVQTKKHTMDARGQRSPLNNEEVHGNLANTHRPNKRRSSNDVPHSFDKEHKRNPFYGKRRRTTPPSTSTKKEVPKDFLVEMPFEEDKKKETGNTETKLENTKLSNAWKLYTDGASSSDGSGARLMLINPEEKDYTYALCFEFKTMNNEAEYEALLAGLQITQEMEIESLAIFADSQLMVNQIKGAYEAKQPTIKEYLKKIKEVLRSFDNYTI